MVPIRSQDDPKRPPRPAGGAQYSPRGFKQPQKCPKRPRQDAQDTFNLVSKRPYNTLPQTPSSMRQRGPTMAQRRLEVARKLFNNSSRGRNRPTCGTQDSPQRAPKCGRRYKNTWGSPEGARKPEDDPSTAHEAPQTGPKVARGESERGQETPGWPLFIWPQRIPEDPQTV